MSLTGEAQAMDAKHRALMCATCALLARWHTQRVQHAASTPPAWPPTSASCGGCAGSSFNPLLWSTMAPSARICSWQEAAPARAPPCRCKRPTALGACACCLLHSRLALCDAKQAPPHLRR